MNPLKSLFASVIALFTLTTRAQDSTSYTKFGFSEFQTVAVKDNADLRFLSWYSKTRPNSLGVWAFGLFTQDLSSNYTFGEGVLGANYTIGSFELGIGAGFETADDPWRVSGYVFAMKNDWSGYVNFEYGGSSYWHLGFVNWKANDALTIGVISQWSTVHGLRLQYNLSESVLLWTGAGIGNNAQAAGLLALRFNY